MDSSVSFLLLLVLCGLTVAEAQLMVFNLRASDLPSDILGTSDGYVKVSCGQAYLGQTDVRKDNANPWWEEEFSYSNGQENNVLKLNVYDSDVLFDDHLGTCERQIKVGTHEHDCHLEKGSTLHYVYTLS
ncbi:protein C2-DOMAIN ABA-RELATED 1-like [Thalassophryne amazonica]|uniref:protein C2-DOMAIN ABA-RELATED 1-like n=1 Tax=Thalassophryne amazonica TaxID=390379 RepID=UPI001471D030|nr:protein C2-DOMAIN ABA-RELATED 1-like [Thalassophryne amazonica]